MKKMVGYFENPKIGCVTPALKVKNPKNILTKIQYSEYILNIFLRKTLAFIDSVPVAPGPFSVYRKNMLSKIGGFDEKNLTEDMEIALRIHNHGYKIENSTNAEVFSICPEKVRELYRQRLRWYRGVIENSLKYKHMFFNPKHGNLGVFYLPMNLISVILIMMLFSVIIYNFTTNFFDLMRSLMSINFDIGVFLDFSKISFSILDMNFEIILISVITLVGGYVLYQSYKTVKESVKDQKIGYMTYLFLFPMILMFFWTMALIYEILRVKKRW